MRKSISVLFIFTSFTIYSQSIMTALNFGKKDDFHSSKLVSETTTYLTFYNSNNSIEKKKYITYCNAHNKVTLELRYDEKDSLKQRLTRMYDETGTRSIGRKLENWHPILGHSSEVALHEYDSNGFLIKVIDKDQNGNSIRETNIKNNQKGDPIELTVSVRNQVQGKETAKYDYDKNEVTIKYFNKNDEIINSQTVGIDNTKLEPGNIVNEYGDIILTSTYQRDIKYDKFGNWIKKIYSKVSNGKIIKKTEEKRTIKYL